MIAERPKPSTRSTTESLELFAGLEFPEVPNRPIILERGSKPTKTTSVQIQEEDLEDAKDVTESTNLLQKDIVTLAESKPLNIQPSANLSTLYATEIITSESRNSYPELPQIMRRAGGVSPAVPPMASVMNRLHVSAGSSVIEGRSDGVELLPQGNTSTLVDDLLQENSRLLDEVTRLRSLLDTQQNTSQPVTIERSTANPTTGVSISNPNAPPVQGVKYVCCGSCRQWLLVDKDAMLVACSNCEAINNCNLIESQQTVSGSGSNIVGTNTSIQTYFPGFSECFSRLFS